MDLFRRYENLLQSDGTNQLQRTLPALEPGYIVPDERDLSDLVAYAQRLAAEIRFYDLAGQSVGDWRPMLEPLVDAATGHILDGSALEAALAARSDWPPHVALFVVFLKLFRHLQDDLNELPQRHLRHYYETELGLPRGGAVADEVHVVFELARNAAATLLPAGTVLDAGKDNKGSVLNYATQNDLVVSSATVADIRRTVTEVDLRGNRRFFVADAISESEANSWYTFGNKQLDIDPSQRIMTEAAFGFAMASPLLRLAEGTRTIDVTATLRAAGGSELPPGQGVGYALEVALTGADGWLTPDVFSAELIVTAGTPVLNLHLTVSEAAAAIVPFDTALHGDGPVSNWPILRCLIKGETGVYETLDGLTMQSATIRVDVKGVRDLVVQNSEGPLSTDKPIPLFGSQPRVGSQLYIGSAEIFSKKLSYLAFNLEWQSPPEDLYDHYRAYFDDSYDSGLTDDFRGFFLADVDLLYDRNWDHQLLINQNLFAPAVTETQRIQANASAFASAFDGHDYDAIPYLDVVKPYAASSKSGFARITLRAPTRRDMASYAKKTPFEAFGHQAFPHRYASQAIALATSTSVPKPLLPNEPYTPVLASLILDYVATAELVPGDAHSPECLYVLGPFGYAEADSSETARLVPEFSGMAALYLGIDKLQTPVNLSLLFQIETGTASAADVLRPGETRWSYLHKDCWHALPSTAVLTDNTYGFQKPGLIVISVPEEATTQHAAMPSDLIWLRAHIQRTPESASRTVAVYTQAALAEFSPGAQRLDEYIQHLQGGLAAHSITHLQERNAAIKRVMQPYGSFNGHSQESDTNYFRRCSERLRHRNRAVTPWDFERLVLEAFPGVFKVKCLPQSNDNGSTKAGETALVIVPDLRSAESSNPLEPRAGTVLMSQIHDYVTNNLTTPFSTVHVIHPVYERLRVDIHVAFRSGLDAGWYSTVLNEDLRRFLSPWAYAQEEDIVFDARIYKSEILAFLEGRDYVDYVTDFNLYHSYDGLPNDGIGQMAIGSDFVIRPDPHPAVMEMVVGEDFIVGHGIEVARTTQPHAILVSHPNHIITPISQGEDRCTGVTQLGIGYMTVSLDFKVQPEYV